MRGSVKKKEREREGERESEREREREREKERKSRLMRNDDRSRISMPSFFSPLLCCIAFPYLGLDLLRACQLSKEVIDGGLVGHFYK